MAGKKNVLSSLAVYAEDSEPESDGEAGVETAGGAPEEKGGLVSEAYGEDDFSRLGGDEDGYEEEEDENSKQSEDDDSETEKPEADDPKDNPEVEKRDPQELVASFSERVRNMSPDEIKIPPEPPGRCSNHLQDKIQKLYERKIKEGMDMNYIIQRKKEFRNPSIYEKLIQFCAIDELGTNYPKDMFDPHGWSEDSYYEALAGRLSTRGLHPHMATTVCWRLGAAGPSTRGCTAPAPEPAGVRPLLGASRGPALPFVHRNRTVSPLAWRLGVRTERD
ncbi:SAP30-binding protein isoform X2 [Meles meles]|uniref:SAP30-binding protein isoform X2 n=1 Tax=Meles meles TaxID=9662 RepID=UPI001E69B0D3|nr:SAP30-binding protein isoform X2 [Meles meles]